MSRRSEVKMQFCRPPADLARFFTTFLLVEIAVGDGGVVSDYLHPEWGNVRFHSGPLVEAENHNGQRIAATTFSATGPSAKALRFTVGNCRIWSIGLLPLGWAKFVAFPAGSLADAVVDGNAHPAFGSFRPLADSLFDEHPDCEAELARITAYFRARLDEPLVDEARIQAIHSALVDTELGTVGELATRVGLSARTIERVCRQVFGFSPKLLLRRQRFMRSLSHFMLDPSLRWIGALDSHYHDQAQFVREFRQFMGMTPSQYAAMEHPILDEVVVARARYAGAAMQALDEPRG